MWGKRRKNKFGNIKVKTRSGVFDSKKESYRYEELKLLQKSGSIRGLSRNKKDCTFEFRHNDVLICKYVADAIYYENGNKVIEDTKSAHTRKNRAYRIKVKLMKAFYDIEIREV